jgi:hypothetical protein
MRRLVALNKQNPLQAKRPIPLSFLMPHPHCGCNIKRWKRLSKTYNIFELFASKQSAITHEHPITHLINSNSKKIHDDIRNRVTKDMETKKSSPTRTTPLIKPTSRARTYRIPNTAETAASIGQKTTGGENFLWATREIAALDFLMNVPLW